MSEFMSAAEVAEEAAAKFNKPKKKRRKKLREKKFDISEIENDHLAQAAQEKQEANAEPERARGRFWNDALREEERKLMGFQNALNKAKIKTDERILAEMAGDVEDEDTELAMALERTKRLAERGVGARSDVDVAREAAARRATDAPETEERDASGEGMVFNDVQEFVHGINVEDKRATRSEAAARGRHAPGSAPATRLGDVPPVPPSAPARMSTACRPFLPRRPRGLAPRRNMRMTR